MKIKVITNFGVFVICIPNFNPNRFAINEYSEEMVECEIQIYVTDVLQT